MHIRSLSLHDVHTVKENSSIHIYTDTRCGCHMGLYIHIASVDHGIETSEMSFEVQALHSITRYFFFVFGPKY